LEEGWDWRLRSGKSAETAADSVCVGESELSQSARRVTRDVIPLPAAGSDFRVSARAFQQQAPVGDCALHVSVAFGAPSLVPLMPDATAGARSPSHATLRLSGAPSPAQRDSSVHHWCLRRAACVAVSCAERALSCKRAGAGAHGGWPLAAAIPAATFAAGDVVRWRVECEDGRGQRARDPPYTSPDAPQFWGTLVAGAQPASTIPVLQWRSSDAAASLSRVGWQVRAPRLRTPAHLASTPVPLSTRPSLPVQVTPSKSPRI